MADGGGGATGSSSSAPLDGAFLLQLLRNPPQSQSQSQSQSHRQLLPHEALTHHHHRDPAVAAVGPTYPSAPHTFLRPPTHHHHHQETLQRFSPPPSSFPPGFSSRDHHQEHRGPPPGFSGGSPPVPRVGDFLANPPIYNGDGARARGRASSDSNLVESLSYAHRQQQRPANSMRLEQHDSNHYHVKPPGNHRNMSVQRTGMMMAEQGRTPGGAPNHHRAPAAPNHHRAPPAAEWVPLQRNADRIREGFNQRERDQTNGQSSSLQSLGGRYGDGQASQHHQRQHQNKQFHQSGGGGMRRSYSFAQDSDRDRIFEQQVGGSQESDGVCDQLEETLTLGEDATESSMKRHSKSSRVKDVRLDLFRGHNVSSQRVRICRRELECRYDIDNLTPLFLTIYKSLIPAGEEKVKQKQLLLSLGKLVNKEWPNAQLHLYGSCANSFGVSNSDIDICLAIDESNMSKSEILLKLAEILESDNLQNVQALIHARVPIVKMMDPVTGISCDICINNLLAVANTKLLRDYAQIDDRLRQLAFIVKHWAKSRGVNETYRGTLSSYAYVIMCIHFLQQRKPAILPCLQEMEATYVVNVDGIQCAYFDQVDRLCNFGAQNNESIARLLWGFFHYWAYYHDYTNDVISVRAGRNISKRAKDWTRRIGNDRHLICIEDPFETSHDLGRVVDKYSIKILREEFERAADVLQYDQNPSVTLFEPYIPRSLPNGLQSD